MIKSNTMKCISIRDKSQYLPTTDAVNGLTNISYIDDGKLGIVNVKLDIVKVFSLDECNFLEQL